jgi:bifunctional DNA-binding transcriptional regulator/antitoxin component of YhaV-PrlF toxin-antitoxin module
MLDQYYSDLQSGFTTTLQKDENGDTILDFPTNLLETMGWKEGDSLAIQSFAGRIIISKVSGE